jgi:hypothetical protein
MVVISIARICLGSWRVTEILGKVVGAEKSEAGHDEKLQVVGYGCKIKLCGFLRKFVRTNGYHARKQ